VHKREEQILSKALLEVSAAAYLVKVKEEKYCFHNLRTALAVIALQAAW
jgi:hypothetical protein